MKALKWLGIAAVLVFGLLLTIGIVVDGTEDEPPSAASGTADDEENARSADEAPPYTSTQEADGFSIRASAECEELTCSLEVSSPDSSIASAEWELGDGGSAEGKSLEHRFPEEGRYSVTVTARNPENATATRTVEVTVEETPTDWPMVGLDHANTASHGPAGNGTGEIVWSFQTDGDVATPVVYDGTVFVGSEDEHLYALDADTGEQRWRYETVAEVETSPVVVNGFAFVSAGKSVAAVSDGELVEGFHGGFDAKERPATIDGEWVYYVEGSTGEHGDVYVEHSTSDERWSYETSSMALSAPVVHEGTIYVGSHDGLEAIEDNGEDIPDAQKQQWTYTRSGPADVVPALHDGLVFSGTTYTSSYGGQDPTFFALDADTGQEAWRTQIPGELTGAPAVANGTVYFGTSDGTLHALDADTGEERWSLDTGGDAVTSSPAVTDDRVYVAVDGGSGKILAVDAASGKEAWESRSLGTLSSSPTVVDGILYIGSNDDRVYALDAGAR